jgi:hypothetical protein
MVQELASLKSACTGFSIGFGVNDAAESHGFPSPSFNGFGFIEKRKIFVRLPSGRSLREAKVRHFEAGPLHNFLEKRV